MKELHFPWMEVSIILPFIGAFVVKFIRRISIAYPIAVGIAVLCFILTVAEAIDFATLKSFEAHDHGDLVQWLFHRDVFVIDKLSAPLLPMAALIYLVTILSTLKTKIARFSLPWTLLSESLLLATLSCRASWILVLLLSIATIPPWVEMKRRDRCTRVYEFHMGVFIACLFVGWACIHSHRRASAIPRW